MKHLWTTNTPARFWRCQPAIPEAQWHDAIQKALPLLGLPEPPADQDTLLMMVLGELQFGANPWKLSAPKRAYYMLKPVIPRPMIRVLRQVYSGSGKDAFALGWPTEPRYAEFLWEVMHQVLLASGKKSLSFQHFWPDGHRYAFVLTHDIELAPGQEYVRAVADLEERFGFRSSFNFVPERYPLDRALIGELVERGFEVGVHGLTHDGKLFNSPATFRQRAERINNYLKEFGAVGFRAPLTHRQPVWMQALEIEYDLSFFDTDPYEPVPGGTMSIWPYMLGRFVELPYTLIQDYTLTSLLDEKTPRLWTEKVDFLERYHGMVLINTHPDYLLDPVTWDVYESFLKAMKERTGYWHALPREVARWWRTRQSAAADAHLPGLMSGTIRLTDSGIQVA